ncbi:hypothetical protein [Dokdonella sp.]|uniref:hypothetical protein n=1 Tax=Dokdonella sp. TaxID=2291710 RepID=UPI00260BDDCE|nr:hypothetical protein [Dokdonella sp.]
MPVVKIRCPKCLGEFVDSRTDWKTEDVARCPKCGTEVSVHPIEIDQREGGEHGSSVHAEPTVAMPLER